MKKILAKVLAVAIVICPLFTGLIPAAVIPFFYSGIGLYEVVARLIPTVKNVSLLSQLVQLLKLLAPNNATGGGEHAE